MGRYKCIFSDVDGTLISSSYHILPKTKRIIKKISGMGIPFVPVSARMPCTMQPLLDEIGIETPMICYSGALTLDENGDAVRSVEIPAQAASEIYHYVNENYTTENCSVYRYTDWVADTLDDPLIEKECGIVQMQPVVRDIDGYLREIGGVHKLFCMGTLEETDVLAASLPALRGDILPCKSKVNYIEITAAGVSKSAAIREFCREQGIAVEETLAIGDHHNDIDMLELAGLGVVMGNAPEEVRVAGDFVTASNDEEGIYLALRELLEIDI